MKAVWLGVLSWWSLIASDAQSTVGTQNFAHTIHVFVGSGRPERACVSRRVPNVNGLFHVSALVLFVALTIICASSIIAFLLLQLGVDHCCLCLKLLLPPRLVASCCQSTTDENDGMRYHSSHKETQDNLEGWKNFMPKVIVARDIVQRPSALTVDSWRDNIIITCPGSRRIVVLDKKFKLIRKIRHQEMIAPQGVAFLQKHDEIYVTDKWKHCIFVFNHKGELVYRMCNKGYGKSELCSPEGITFHPERSVLYIADTGNNRIQILEKDGTYLDSIGPKNKNTGDTVKFRKTGPSKLNQPTDVAVTIMHVIVADSGNHKIKIFNHDGQILQSIGGIGTTKGLFRSPEVLKIDDKGYIIVGDAGNGRVQIFSPEGKNLRFLFYRINECKSNIQ
ncbi:PREDICTED: RING finger protein nhl-1-like [Acromyrmex echinatior]|uniref:RING finger protein nhl-1-like n=1 Tax=Acromyrmex echinatior TaxID=103372 RepID=UPI000580EA5C|nr:PREDICTED: RING finger protein nhl-1-like [Acromyrmex echinatior]